jgi:hypothetical protein
VSLYAAAKEVAGATGRLVTIAGMAARRALTRVADVEPGAFMPPLNGQGGQ